MVKKSMIFLAFMLFFLLNSMYFAPKENIYFIIEHELKKYDIIISNEKIKDTGFGLELHDAELSFKAISSAEVKEVDIKLFALYNSIALSNIKLSQTASSFLPLKINKIKVTHSIFNPLNINIYETGDNGEIRGSFSLIDRTLHIIFKPSKLMLKEYKNSLREFKKSEDGEYIYDKSI